MVKKHTAGSGRLEDEAKIRAQMRCRHTEEPAKEIITLRGRTAIINAWHCVKCGEVAVSPDEAERARKELNPSIGHKVKEFFGAVEDVAEALVFKGKVL